MNVAVVLWFWSGKFSESEEEEDRSMDVKGSYRLLLGGQDSFMKRLQVKTTGRLRVCTVSGKRAFRFTGMGGGNHRSPRKNGKGI